MTFGEASECYYPKQLPGGSHWFSSLSYERQTIGRFPDASGKDESLGGRCMCFTEVWSESRWLRFGFGLRGVQLLSGSLSCPQDLSTFELLWRRVHFLFGVVTPPSVLWTTALSLDADRSLALLNPSLRNPSERLSCFPWRGVSLHPKQLRLHYEGSQVFSQWTLDFQTLKSLSSLHNSVVLTMGYSLVILKTPRTGHCCWTGLIWVSCHPSVLPTWMS